MRDSNFRRLNQTRAIALVLLTIFLWGCADKPQKTTPESVTPVPVKPSVEEQSISLTLPPSSYSATFSSAEQALTQFDWMRASIALDEIPTDTLAPNDNTYRAYLQARITYIRGNQESALSQLKQLSHQSVHPALRYRILSLQFYILEMHGDSLESAQLADHILRTAPRDYTAAWKRSVWRNLQRTDKEQLIAAAPFAIDSQWRGWLDLAVISRDNSPALTGELAQWRQSNATHPAATPLPAGLGYLQASSERGGTVALLLPLSGKLAPAGKAVLDGFMAAYYAQRAIGGANYDLLVMDLNNYPSASHAYDDAVSRGAYMLVGPLSKPALADLATRLERPIPILALNRIDQVLPASGSALVQLSLAPEDEARRIADLAFGQGARRALIITPVGDWGDKMEHALRDQWATLGGTVASSATYDNPDDYSSSVKSTLALDTSEQRSSDIRRMLATNIEFTPRRRQDLDVIFLLSRNGSQASSIKPLLAFHYAGDLPVYATSSIYNGVPDERNQDLNGIRLVEIPWLLGANPELRAAISAGDTTSGSYTRLNALGADAFLLQSGFGRLQSGADALVRGNTGLLSMDPNLQIYRELSAATFDGGALKPQ